MSVVKQTLIERGTWFSDVMSLNGSGRETKEEKKRREACDFRFLLEKE